MKDDIFNPNSYTEKAMPLTSALFDAFSTAGLQNISSVHKQFLNDNSEVGERYKNFYDSLNEEQKKILDDDKNLEIEEYTLANTEKFCAGFKLGAMLMKELLG